MNNRLISLDAFRGFTIMFMIIVNTPGSWSHVFPPLLHASWNGVTPTDYVFPFFLFIVGVSIVLAYSNRMQNGADKKAMAAKAIWRAVKIYALGLFLWLFPEFDFENIRYAGVLQRISLVFLFSTLIYLYTTKTFWLRAGIFTLLAYWIIVAYFPVPGIGAPDLSVPEKNWAHYLDSILLPGKMWQKTWDPEGILSTFPSIVTGISGMLVGQWLIEEKDVFKKLTRLFFWGFILLVLGEVTNWFFPINKNLWTSSYVLHTSGLAMLTLGSFIWIVDYLGIKNWTRPGVIFGANAITAYVLAGMLTVVFYNSFGDFAGLNKLFVDGVGSLIGFKLASLVYALIYVGIIFIPVYVLYVKKIFIKL